MMKADSEVINLAGHNDPYLLWGTFDHWGKVAKNIADNLDGRSFAFGLLYLAEGHGSALGSVLTFLRETTKIKEWLGAVVPSLLVNGTEIKLQHGFAILALDQPLGPVIAASTPQMAEEATRDAQGAALLLGYQRPDLADFLYGVARHLYVVGGVVSMAAPVSLATTQPHFQGIAGVVIPKPLGLISALSQGCTPIGPIREVTKAQDGIVMGLDGRSALDVLKEDAGELIARDLRRASGYIHVALPVGDGPEYLVRNLLGVDPKHGWLALTDRLEKGTKIMFVRRDPMEAREQMTQMVEDLAFRAAGRKVLAAHAVVSMERGERLFGTHGIEMEWLDELMEQHFGKVPLIGFQTSAEINEGRIYNYSHVLSLILAPNLDQ